MSEQNPKKKEVNRKAVIFKTFKDVFDEEQLDTIYDILCDSLIPKYFYNREPPVFARGKTLERKIKDSKTYIELYMEGLTTLSSNELQSKTEKMRSELLEMVNDGTMVSEDDCLLFPIKLGKVGRYHCTHPNLDLPKLKGKSNIRLILPLSRDYIIKGEWKKYGLFDKIRIHNPLPPKKEKPEPEFNYLNGGVLLLYKEGDKISSDTFDFYGRLRKVIYEDLSSNDGVFELREYISHTDRHCNSVMLYIKMDIFMEVMTNIETYKDEANKYLLSLIRILVASETLIHQMFLEYKKWSMDKNPLMDQNRSAALQSVKDVLSEIKLFN